MRYICATEERNGLNQTLRVFSGLGGEAPGGGAGIP